GDPRGPGASLEAVELGGGRIGDRAASALLRPLLNRRARHPVGLLPQRELETQLGPDVRRGMHRAERDAGLIPRAGHLAVEREAHGVQQRGLAHAGGPFDEEELVAGERAEVHLHLSGEGTERRHVQLLGSHANTSSPPSSFTRTRTLSHGSDTPSRPLTAGPKAPPARRRAPTPPRPTARRACT